MRGGVCYLGDGCLNGAAGYLAAIMQHYRVEFEHVPSDSAPPDKFASEAYSLYVVSDYPAKRFGLGAMQHVADCVEQGTGLLMLGGWESFYGRLGEYHNSPLANVLPVVMQQCDDRRNFAQPCLVKKVADHPTVDGLPWHEPPGIGGCNAISPKPNTETILTTVQFRVRYADETFEFSPGAETPLLILGQHGRGRTAALATDVAPHWVGGMVDWGDGRVVEEIAGETVEIGNWYAEFFRNLLVWASAPV